MVKPHCPNCGHDVAHVNGPSGQRCAEPCLCGSGWRAPHDPPHIGVEVVCTTCGKHKAPRGRSLPVEFGPSLCTDDCSGYYEEPKPGDLFLGESCVDFGYAHTMNATREHEPTDSQEVAEHIEFLRDTLGLFKS